METVRKGAEDWEEAVLDGGPAHGMRVRVAGRPRMLQVTQPCLLEQDPAGEAEPAPSTAEAVLGTSSLRVDALHVYRWDPHAGEAPLRYGFDPASP